VGGDAFVGAFLQTNPTFQQLNGYWEVTMWAPKTPNTDLLVWMLDASGAQEIDLWEIFTDSNGNQTGKFGMWTPGPPKVLNDTVFSYNLSSPPDMTQPQRYGIDWGASTASFYINRQLVQSWSTPAGYTAKMFWILSYSGNTDQGGSNPNPGALPAFGFIDAVNTWTSRPF
jgi:hypothetical protein